MKLRTQTYVILAVLAIFCLKAANAVDIHMNGYLFFSGDSIKTSKLANLKEKIKVIHKTQDNQVRIETEFPAADPLTAEIINMIGVSCQKINFRVNATMDYTLKPGIYFVVIYENNQRIFTSKILVSQ